MNPKEKALRKLSENAFYLLKKTRISAEFLTILRLVLAFLTAIILFRGEYVSSAISFTAYQFILLLDYIDGPIAHYQKNYKINWVYLDHQTHIILTVLFLTAVNVSYFNFSGNIDILMLGLVGAFAVLFNSTFSRQAFLASRFNIIKKSPPSRTSELISAVFKIEEPISLFFVFIVLDLRVVLIIVYSAVYILATFYKFVSTFNSLKNERYTDNQEAAG